MQARPLLALITAFVTAVAATTAFLWLAFQPSFALPSMLVLASTFARSPSLSSLPPSSDAVIPF